MTAYSDVLHVDEWGAGDRVVLVHGSLATGADDIVTLMGDGAHLVGHSYGGLGAMIAAARRADALLALWRSAGPTPATAAQLPRPARSMSQVVSSGGV